MQCNVMGSMGRVVNSATSSCREKALLCLQRHVLKACTANLSAYFSNFESPGKAIIAWQWKSVSEFNSAGYICMHCQALVCLSKPCKLSDRSVQQLDAWVKRLGALCLSTRCCASARWRKAP